MKAWAPPLELDSEIVVSTAAWASWATMAVLVYLAIQTHAFRSLSRVGFAVAMAATILLAFGQPHSWKNEPGESTAGLMAQSMLSQHRSVAALQKFRASDGGVEATDRIPSAPVGWPAFQAVIMVFTGMHKVSPFLGTGIATFLLLAATWVLGCRFAGPWGGFAGVLAWASLPLMSVLASGAGPDPLLL